MHVPPGVDGAAEASPAAPLRPPGEDPGRLGEGQDGRPDNVPGGGGGVSGEGEKVAHTKRNRAATIL